ncbi:MAG: GMP synthase [glutamine-hydrolyzing] [Anaerolineales bacterium]|nr:GMP synthase [glutamine-hydrolyzing] [Anaerolineales bacterium]
MTIDRETVVILDFGSQTAQLIARRVRECQVYSELLPADAPPEDVQALNPAGFILSGGPASVYEPGAPTLPDYVLASGKPVLGICYGMQLLTHHLGGEVAPAERREYGLAELHVDKLDALFRNLPDALTVWMSHGDRIEQPPAGFRVLAHTDNSPIAAMGDPGRRLYGIQFHPEVVHTPRGCDLIRNFLHDACGLRGAWTPGAFIEESVAAVRRQVGDGQVALGLSGGVDSSVTAALVHRAVGDQLTCIFVDHGLLRAGEADQVIDTFRRNMGLRLVFVDATDEFLGALRGVSDPEKKRQVIGERFVRIFEREARKLGQIDFLAQGTIYPDVIESAARDRPHAKRIKTHHNVGGLPEDMDFELVEPLRYLFKDEVRNIGLELGLPAEIVRRQPFPGPGLAVRILGEVTRKRLETLRAADAIVCTEISAADPKHHVWQYFAALPLVRSVGVMGDGRSYGHLIAVRAVTSQDGMTADWARLSDEVLTRISTRIVNEVPGVNRVVYDITSKPPATIEWE